MRTLLMQGRFEIPEKILVNHNLINYKELIDKYNKATSWSRIMIDNIVEELI